MQPSNTPEEWRPVAGWEGHYEVSDHGRVRSVPRRVIGSDGRRCDMKGRVLAQQEKDWGHLVVTFHRGGNGPSRKRKTFTVHRLVCEAFNGSQPDGMWALHRDGDPKNNVAENLYWGTPKQNAQDSVRHRTNANVRKTHCPRGHEYVESNIVRNPSRPTSRRCRTCKADQQRMRAAHVLGQEADQ